MPNRPKQFEDQIEKDFNRVPHTSVYRLHDDESRRKGVRNICDYIMYHYPHIYYIECKIHKGASIPLTCITDGQKEGLIRMSKINGVCAGLIIWFTDKDTTIFISGTQLENIINSGAKSIRFDYPTYRFYGKKKRVLFNYDIQHFLNFIEEEYKNGKDDNEQHL